MTHKDIDELLQGASASEVDRALIERVQSSVLSSLKPVRPLPATSRLVTVLLLASALLAVAGGAIQGMYGFHAMSGTQRLVTFAVWSMVALAAAAASVREMTPATGRRVNPLLLLLIACGPLAMVFAALLPVHFADDFVRAGLRCLAMGLLWAIPGALLTWLVFRRGFVLDARAAGAAAGTVGGIIGIGVLEFHCPNLEATHVIAWHLAVIAIAAFAGFLAGMGVSKADGTSYRARDSTAR